MRWTSPIKSGMGSASSRGKIVGRIWGLEELQWGFFFAFFFLNHALHVRGFMETLWLTEMERMRSKPKWETRVVGPKLGWQSWNSSDSLSGWSWPKLCYKNKTPSSAWTRNDTSQYCIVEPIWNRTLITPIYTSYWLNCLFYDNCTQFCIYCAIVNIYIYI